MKKIVLLLAMTTLLSLPAAMGQYELAKDGFAARAVFLNYQWPAITSDFVGKDFTSGLEIEYIRHLNKALNLSFPLKLARADLPLDQLGKVDNASVASLDALLQLKFFRERSFVYPYLFAGIGGVAESFDQLSAAAPLGLGLNFRLARHTYLSTKAEYRIGFKDLRDNAQLGAGLLLVLGEGPPKPVPVQDRDGDGIPDNQDLCPDQAGTPGLNGCPDQDNDGVPDGEDQCPDQAGLAAFQGCPDSDGDGLPDRLDECPNEFGPIDNKGCPIRDTDRDGVPDDSDACPTQPGPAALNGCPDRDGDGIADKDDACPNSAGPRATQGCPDADGDGVIDSQDRCPNTPGPAATNGCPEITKEEKEVLEFATRAVQFETGSARLLSSSTEVLNQIVQILRRYPDYHLRIGGHTDSIGSATSNQVLSENRAQACYDYLLSQGISPERITYAGFGETRPIADNRYKDGREKNRRVEFDIFLPE